MEEREFLELADTELAKIEDALDRLQERIDADCGDLLVRDWTDVNNWIYGIGGATDGGKTLTWLSTGATVHI